ncbi:MAG TPA: amidohydrolase family protein, partial [Candidatus Thermoplasmatota archaeon]|nr:amidohydrolase family protein [Candidatus Thermoplasmatota archaeon]
GTLVAVGPDAEALAFVGEGTRVIDLAGAFMMPGLRDNHAHVLDVVSVLPASEVAAALRPAPFIETEEQAEVRHEQDFATQLVYHGSRSVDAAVDEDGRNLGPASLYEDCGAGLVGEGVIPSPSEELVASFMAAEEELARQGLTTVVEAQLRNMTHVAALLQIEESGASKLRWQLRVVPGCYPLLDRLGLTPDSPGDWVRLLGVKQYTDGYLGAWIAALREPYSDRPGWSGIRAYDADTLLYRTQEARQRGLTVATHAIGDASTQQVIDAYEAAGITAADRSTIEHASVLDPGLIGRMADLGIIASVQPSFATTDRVFAEDRVGPERVQGVYATRGLIEAGVPIVFSSDYPIEVIHPWWTIQRAVTRQELDGSGAWQPKDAVSVEEALRFSTWGQAYASKEEAGRGTLAVGKAADLVVLREDPFMADPSTLASATLLLTVVNGLVSFEGEAAYPPPVPWDAGAVAPPLRPGRPNHAH